MPPEILAMVLGYLDRLQLAHGPSLANRLLSAIANFCINSGGKRKLANLSIEWAVGKLPEPDSRLIYVAWIENEDIRNRKAKMMEKERQSKELMKETNDDGANTESEHKEVDQGTNGDDNDDSDTDEQPEEKLLAIPIPTTTVPENFEGFRKIEIRYLNYQSMLMLETR